MQVILTLHGEELLKQQLARGLGRSPEEVIERALETAGRVESVYTGEDQERRRQAVADMIAVREKHHLTLGPGLSIRDLILEGRKY